MRDKRIAHAGIAARHSRSCRSRDEKPCNCSPSWQVTVGRGRGRRYRTFTTRNEAKAWRAEATVALNKGTVKAPTKVTVTDAWEKTRAGMRDGTVRNRSGDLYKPSAIRGYETSMRKRVLPDLGPRKLSEVRRVHVQAMVDRWLGEGLNPSTIRNTLNPLQVIFRRAVQRDQVAVNPTVGLELAAVRGRRDRIAPPEEAAALLAALPEEQRALWAVAFYAGLRRGEVRALRCADVDFEKNCIRVERAWDDVDGVIAGKTFAARRSVPIFAPLRKELAAHKLRTGRAGEDLLLGMTAEHPFDPSTVRRRARAAWKRAELSPIGLHEARHTAASFMIAAGLNIKEISTYMGHASVTITLDRYGHLFPSSGDEAIAKMDAYFAAAKPAR